MQPRIRAQHDFKARVARGRGIAMFRNGQRSALFQHQQQPHMAFAGNIQIERRRYRHIFAHAHRNAALRLGQGHGADHIGGQLSVMFRHPGGAIAVIQGNDFNAVRSAGNNFRRAIAKAGITQRPRQVGIFPFFNTACGKTRHAASRTICS